MYSLKKEGNGLTLQKNERPMICSSNAQPFIGGTNSIGQPIMSQFFCGDWCNKFKSDDKKATIYCGCEKIEFELQESIEESKVIMLK